MYTGYQKEWQVSTNLSFFLPILRFFTLFPTILVGSNGRRESALALSQFSYVNSQFSYIIHVIYANIYTEMVRATPVGRRPSRSGGKARSLATGRRPIAPSPS